MTMNFHETSPHLPYMEAKMVTFCAVSTIAPHQGNGPLTVLALDCKAVDKFKILGVLFEIILRDAIGIFWGVLFKK